MLVTVTVKGVSLVKFVSSVQLETNVMQLDYTSCLDHSRIECVGSAWLTWIVEAALGDSVASMTEKELDLVARCSIERVRVEIQPSVRDLYRVYGALSEGQNRECEQCCLAK